MRARYAAMPRRVPRYATAKLTPADVLEARIFAARHPELSRADLVRGLMQRRPWPVCAETLTDVLMGQSFPRIQPQPWQVTPPVVAVPARWSWLVLFLVLLAGAHVQPATCFALCSRELEEGVSA
jgi:hypothetical protein